MRKLKRSKKCKICGRLLTLESFYRCSAVKDGRGARCKACMSREQKERLKNPEVRAYRVAYSKRWNNSLKGRKYHKKYKKTKEYKQKDRLRMQTPLNIQKSKAREAINCALRYGRTNKKPCAICGKKGTEAHHILGYAKEHWTEVVWLCNLHHRKAEERIRNERERNNIST